jgi:hypothetical protein
VAYCNPPASNFPWLDLRKGACMNMNVCATRPESTVGARCRLAPTTVIPAEAGIQLKNEPRPSFPSADGNPPSCRPAWTPALRQAQGRLCAGVTTFGTFVRTGGPRGLWTLRRPEQDLDDVLQGEPDLPWRSEPSGRTIVRVTSAISRHTSQVASQLAPSHRLKAVIHLLF